ncbi:MAG: phage holin family protein [Flavobacteriaceae bacterium]|nr:phage holin family protein [Flavobacteriaceae bacterium]
MFKTILRVFFTAFVTLLLSYFLPGIYVESPEAALIVAVVLGLLRIFIKPLLILLTLPVTIFTLGLFLLVVNAIIILIADHLVKGFDVSGFWYALLFSILLSMFQSIFNQFLENKKR